MGVVYEAFDPSLNRKLAIKVLRIDKTMGTEMDTRAAKNRLLREAQAMAQVGHPNLVAVYDVGTFGASVFIAMEMVNGLTLRDWRPNIPKRDWQSILNAYIQAGQGLSAAHHQSLIHRDFKPENVMIGHEDSRVRVMDFGLVRSVKAEPAHGSSNALARPLTQTGMIMGTPAYMAPEQFLGDETDHTTDQFSFCVALYEALYGHRPFKGKNASALARNVLQGKITLPPRKCPVPGYILNAILKGLQTDPADRHDSMDVLLDALREPDTLPNRPWHLYLSMVAVAALGYTLFVTTQEPIVEQEAAAVSVSAPEPTGTIPFGAANTLMGANKADVERCAQVAKTLDVGATYVTLRVHLTAAGKVKWVHGNGTDEILLLCFRRFVEKWEWPTPDGGPTTVVLKIPLEERVVQVPATVDPAAAAPPKKPSRRRSR